VIGATAANVGYPLGSADVPQAVIANGTTWNEWAIGFGGSGWTYGQQNFLLKHDLDPASNDNTPMFVDQAA
jgi:hypothetical protein